MKNFVSQHKPICNAAASENPQHQALKRPSPVLRTGFGEERGGWSDALAIESTAGAMH
jgi:hypothetical protein